MKTNTIADYWPIFLVGMHDPSSNKKAKHITRRKLIKTQVCAMCKNLQSALWPDPKNLSRFLEERRANGRKCRYSSMSHGTRIASKVLNAKA